MNTKTRHMAHNSSNRYFLLNGPLIFGNLPLFKILIDVGIERKKALFPETGNSHTGYWFGNRGRLEYSPAVYYFIFIFQTVTTGPNYFSLIENSYTHSF